MVIVFWQRGEHCAFSFNNLFIWHCQNTHQFNCIRKRFKYVKLLITVNLLFSVVFHCSQCLMLHLFCRISFAHLSQQLNEYRSFKALAITLLRTPFWAFSHLLAIYNHWYCNVGHSVSHVVLYCSSYWGHISLLLPRLPKLPSQCYSDWLSNFGSLCSNVKCNLILCCLVQLNLSITNSKDESASYGTSLYPDNHLPETHV